MIKRSERNSILIEIVGQRCDIPRSIFQQLIAKASDEVSKMLERERPDMAIEIQTLVADVTSPSPSVFDPHVKGFSARKKAVSVLHRYGNLDEKDIFEYSQADKFPEVMIGLSFLLCSLPANIIERGLIDDTGEMPIIFAKSLDYSWETAMSLLFLGATDFRLFRTTP